MCILAANPPPQHKSSEGSFDVGNILYISRNKMRFFPMLGNNSMHKQYEN